MGWTYLDKDKNQSVLDFFKEQFEYEDEHGKLVILDGGVVALREFYAACEVTKKSGEVSRFGLVCLLDYPKNYDYNFGYKDMSEDCGPNACRCPKRIYDLIKDYDPNHEWANKWRKRVEAYHAQREKAKLKNGQKIKLKNPLRFTDGRERQALTYKKIGRRSFFEDEFGMRVVISNWRDREFSLIES